jgi:N-sulfoglucosamine sulfohydrolase
MSLDLGCYGDPYSVSPNIDRLASQGVRYTHAYATAPVCAPSRSAIITGMYATSIGTHQMRCQGVPPSYVKCFPEYLRAAGYYCTNNSKTDYQFAPPITAWDDNSNQAHWRGRADGQPFFAVFNLTVTHESQIRSDAPTLLQRLRQLTPEERHDPDKAVLPPYYPDTPVVRRDWARYYDLITLMDKEVGRILQQLEDDGLAEDTVVFFWSDHGRGLPRGKRWVYDSGMKVPLIVRVPEKWRKRARPDAPNALQPGTVNDDLISLFDLGPTVLKLSGLSVPKYMQARPFLGEKPRPRDYVFAHRDRMDEAVDIIRGVRDKRFKYVRNFMPYVSYGQDNDYMNQMPTMREMRRLHAEGKLVGAQTQYFRTTKPVEELFDTANDPHEIHNLADDPHHSDRLKNMRKALLNHMKETGDVGLIPEPQFDEMKRPGGVWQQAQTPALELRDGMAKVRCGTPGASLAYRLEPDDRPGWRLYTQPIRLPTGQKLLVKAHRLGFLDSQLAMMDGTGKLLSPPPSLPANDRSDWRTAIDKTDLLRRLVDMQPTLTQPDTIRSLLTLLSLLDESAPVRYWAVVELDTFANSEEADDFIREELRKRLTDRSTVVQIAAAQALCEMGREKEALSVLIRALNSGSDSVRLYASIALQRIGEKARPVMAEIAKHKDDRSEYVQRVTEYTLRRLQKGAGNGNGQ